MSEKKLKLKYLWQSLKCAWGWHDIERKDSELFDTFMMLPCNVSVISCSHCEYADVFYTYKIQGKF